MCVGASRAIDCLDRVLSCHCRPIYNKPASDYRMCSLRVIAIPTGAASRAIVRKGENVGDLGQYFVDYRVCWELSPQWRWYWEMRYTSPNDCPGPRSHIDFCRFFNRMGLKLIKVDQHL